MGKKLCKNGCGIWIEWDNDKKYFKDVNSTTGQRHDCPNWNSKRSAAAVVEAASTTPTTTAATVPTQIDTTERTMAEILRVLKRLEKHVFDRNHRLES
jgi:hypothetical protein